MKIILRKSGKALVPTDEHSETAIAKLKDGAHVHCTITQARNPQFHRLYWALVKKVWDNVDHDKYPTMEDLHTALKIVSGHRIRVHMPNGEVAFAAKSIAFDKMDNASFSEFYDNVCDQVAKRFLPGVTSEELRAEVGQMIGIAA